MKSILNRSLLLVVTVLVLSGCGRNSPKDVAQTWLTAFYHMDAEAAMKVSTASTKNLLNTLSVLTGELSEEKKAELKKIQVTIKDVKEVDNSNVVVTYTSTGDPKEHTLNLVRQSDKWLVQFTKTDLGKQMENEEDVLDEEEPAPAPADTTQPQPVEAGQ